MRPAARINTDRRAAGDIQAALTICQLFELIVS